MNVSVFNGEKINVGDEVAYPSRGDDGKSVLRKARVVEITQRAETAGRVVTKIKVDAGHWNHVALRNLKTVVKL